MGRIPINNIINNNNIINKKVRWIPIKAANTASRTVDRLWKFYIRLVKRYVRHNAITHIANKMCTMAYAKIQKIIQCQTISGT